MTVGMFMEKAWAEILDYLDLERKKYGGSTLLDKVYLHATGKGFRFPDDATAQKMVDTFKEREKSIRARAYLIDTLESCINQTFSYDETSESYRKTALTSVATLRQLNDSALRYTQNYIEKIEAARKRYAQQEEAAENDARGIAR